MSVLDDLTRKLRLSQTASKDAARKWAKRTRALAEAEMKWDQPPQKNCSQPSFLLLATATMVPQRRRWLRLSKTFNRANLFRACLNQAAFLGLTSRWQIFVGRRSVRGSAMLLLFAADYLDGTDCTLETTHR